MPSVRVRRGSQYASLFDGDNGEQAGRLTGRPRSQTISSFYRYSAFGRPNTAHSQEATESASPVSPILDRDSAPTNNEPERNEDSLRSRVADSILSSSRASRALRGYRSYDRPLLLRSSGPENHILHGSQTDVVVPDGGDHRPGRLESNLSVSSAGDEDPFEGSNMSLNHEDDIVEHLEVIDPQISTISNLANTANAILIPPIGVYSRKPVVVLPRMAFAEDAEKVSVHEDDLDRHVEEVLSKRSKLRRTLKGVWSFLKTPMGIIVGIYGFLVVFWGAAIVLFLARMINLHNSLQQGFWIEVSSQIENALFTVTGVGLIPWRVIDTYRILRIWRYKTLTKRLRAKAGLPELYDEDDLPDPMYDPNYVHVLTDKQQVDLHYQQQQFMKSQTWYRPHGTATHRAFPINAALLICCFIDGNSIFQCVLCGTMWGLNRFQRPPWSTGLLIPATFLCGILSGVFIWRGGQKTKRTKEVEERLRMALTLERNPGRLAVIGDKVIHNNFPSGPERPNYRPLQQNSQEDKEKSYAEQSTGATTPVPSIYVEEEMHIPRHIPL